MPDRPPPHDLNRPQGARPEAPSGAAPGTARAAVPGNESLRDVPTPQPTHRLAEDTADQNARLDEVLADIMMALDQGREYSLEAWQQQYPDLAESLAACLKDLETVEQWAAPIRQCSPPQLTPGHARDFGDYELWEEIGRGGMGVVYKARQRSLQRWVAVKMLRAGQFADSEDVRRFHSEAQAAANLDHPHIVPIHEVGTHEGHHYYSMPWVDGTTLDAQLRPGPLPSRQAAELARTLAEATAYAHRNGIVHRDLKPANVLIDATGQPRIADFGLAKRLQPGGHLTATDQILGTPSYMSPEQCGVRPDAVVGPASDVFALGSLLYAMLTGRPPFQGSTPWETVQLVVNAEPVLPRTLNPTVPLDLQTVCLKCLEKEPARRYESAAALAEDLTRFLRGEPVRARAQSRLRRGARWAARHPAWASLILVLALSAAVALGGIVTHNRLMQVALGQAQQHAESAERERSRATTNYELARETLRKMVARLEDPRLAAIPRLRELRREFADDALAFYESVRQNLEEPDTAINYDAALAYRLAGDLRYQTGQYQAAQDAYRKSLQLWEELHRQDPANRQYTALLAAQLNNLAVFLGQDPEAESLLKRALELRRKELESGQTDWLSACGESHHNLGSYYQRGGQAELAVEHYRRAVDCYRQAEPGQPALAESLSTLGLVLSGSDPDEALKTMQEAHAIFAPLIEADANRLEVATSLAANLNNLGNLQRNLGNLEHALANYDQAITTLQAVLRQEPSLTQTRHMLCMSAAARGQLTMFYLHDPAGSVEDWRLAGELAETDAVRKTMWNFLALALARSNRRDETLDVVSRLEPLLGTAEEWYNLGCIHALLIPDPEQMPAPADAERIAGEQARSAVACLNRAAETGYFEDSAIRAHLFQDPDLVRLRGRPEWPFGTP